MTIFFGLDIEDKPIPTPSNSSKGIFYCNPNDLANFLSAIFGLPKAGVGSAYLRLEQYRQAIYLHQKQHPSVLFFYTNSFNSDPFSTASDLLSRRDELIINGYNFDDLPDTPNRIQVLGAIEKCFQSIILSQGKSYFSFSDRWIHLLRLLPFQETPIEKVHLCEPKAILPAHIIKLLEILEQSGVEVIPVDFEVQASDTDLGKFQRRLFFPEATTEKSVLEQDGSLILIKGSNEAQLSRYIAVLKRKNPAFNPFCFIPGTCKALDYAFIQEGLPSFGIKSASLSRPSLQVLKLATSFLWKPIDPYKILEFASLQHKPLHPELALIIANHVSQQPGIKGDGWYAAINEFFRAFEQENNDAPSVVKEARFQYQFWFERNRYDSKGAAPKKEIKAIFEFIESWAYVKKKESAEFEDAFSKLAIQARKIIELLEALSEQYLRPIEIERILKTINEPAALSSVPPQTGHLDYTGKIGAVTSKVDQLLWWNFVDSEQDYFFSKWFKDEIDFLDSRNIKVISPNLQNAQNIWRKKHPVRLAQRQLLLIIPEKIEGRQVAHHSLMGNIEAFFKNVEAITFDISQRESREQLSRFFRLPEFHEIRQFIQSQPSPFLEIPGHFIDKLLKERQETPTSLEQLLYFPYQWFFRYILKITASPVQQIVGQKTLFGNLSHRLIENLMQEEFDHWEKDYFETWVENQLSALLQREGSTLLLYGKEAERINFINQVKYAVWSLIHLIKKNGWSVEATEKNLEGMCGLIPLKGRCDLILTKEKQKVIIDLKWGGHSYRINQIKNEEDLQLVIYSNFIREETGEWPHTSFYIISRGKMIARNRHAFSDIQVVPVKDEPIDQINQRILNRILATYEWRMKQIKEGKIEIRHKDTVLVLDDYYGGSLLNYLEMKKESPLFDDYKILIDLVC